VGRFGAHILLGTFASVGDAIMAFQCFAILVRMFHESIINETKVGGGMILSAIILVVPAVGACVALFDSILEVFRPFFQNLDDSSRQKLF